MQAPMLSKYIKENSENLANEIEIQEQLIDAGILLVVIIYKTLMVSIYLREIIQK